MILLNDNKLFACTKLEEVRMHLTVSLLHLSGGKDEQEGPAAVKRILREHRQAKGKITSSSWNPHTYIHTYIRSSTCARGHRCRSVPPRPPGSHSGFIISGLLLEKQGKTLRTQQKNHHRRGGDEVEMTNGQIQRGTRTARRCENGGNEWVTEIRRDK